MNKAVHQQLQREMDTDQSPPKYVNDYNSFRFVKSRRIG